MLAFGSQFVFSQSTNPPGGSLNTGLPNPSSPPLSPCPGPEREPRFIYKEKVIHEERQFRVEYPGCGGDIMMRKWQVIGIQLGSCSGSSCSNPYWYNQFIYFYDRYTPDKTGLVFEEVGSWQKAWPSEAQWLTEEELNEKYGEPIPFPTCQNDCLKPPPGTPENAGVAPKDEPFYFNNPWLPGIIGGATPGNIDELREKNILGGTDPLDKVPLPTKIFWWNIPGWHEGWIENGQLQKIGDDPENIAYVHSYIIRFDNINREDRPATFHRHNVVNGLVKVGAEYIEAQNIYERLVEENRRSYERYRRNIDDVRTVDLMRYDRDNIIGCDECGGEQEIWLKTNTFNPLEFDPLYNYDRPHREWMKKDLKDRFLSQLKDEGVSLAIRTALGKIIDTTYNSYGRPGFFRSGAEHHYTLQAACYPHDYLEEGSGRWGPEARYFFETSTAPELISPLDPNWVSPYDPKTYDPDFSTTRLKTEEYGYDEGYQYPAEKDEGDDEYLMETEGISNLGVLALSPLWNKVRNDLLLQDQVAFREELKWTQQWYQTNPETSPRPPQTYLLSFGEGIRVSQENIDDYGNPVLEDCHYQLKDTFHDQPICTYTTRPRGTHETYLKYPLPNYLDREFELFTLPEDSKKDIYSWNVSACSDLGATDCTDFSQLWRFQLDEREEERLFPPKSIDPLNIKNEKVRENDAMVGFPFSIKWERRFGARSYVFRIASKEDGFSSPLDARIVKDQKISYPLKDLIDEDDSIFDLDTYYVWDVKACWDDKIDHGKSNPQDILNWAKENKQCSKWSSDYYAADIVPFEFITTGRPPVLEYPIEKDKISLPISFEWEAVPGAKGYIFLLEKTFGGDFQTAYTTKDSNLLYEKEITLENVYDWKVATCASFVDKEEFDSRPDIDKLKEKYSCGEFSEPETFLPYIAFPKNLSPGVAKSDGGYSDPEKISIENSHIALSWDAVDHAKAYQVSINGIPRSVTSNNYYFYNFNQKGKYGWSVIACLDNNCAPGYQSDSSETYYIKVTAPPEMMGGIVPCGRNVNIFPADHPLDSREDCRPIHLLVMIGLIIENILVKIIIPYSLIILLLYTGYLYYRGLGDSKTMQKVFKVWEYALKGYLLIILAWFIVGIFLSLIGYQFGIWWDISVSDIYAIIAKFYGR